MARWRDLDFEPARQAGAGAQAAAQSEKDAPQRRRERRHGPLAGMAPPRDPAVAAARGLYLLKNWQGVVNALGPEVLQEPEAEGGWLLCALALARLSEEAAAEAAFQRALSAGPDDLFTRCAYASFLLHHGRDEQARAVLLGVQVFGCSGVQEATTDDRPPAGLSYPTPEHLTLLAACDWLEGQRLLGAGRAAEASERFAAAGQGFVAAAEGLTTARQALPERLAAVYVGQVVSLVLAGRLDAALQLYGRLRPPRPAPSLEPFVQGLHELCRLLAGAAPEERQTVAGPFAAAVAGTQMVVGLWDGSQPVSIAWRAGVGQ